MILRLPLLMGTVLASAFLDFFVSDHRRLDDATGRLLAKVAR